MTHPWFQIHLSTCIAVMFTLSIFLSLNFYPRRIPFQTPEFPDAVITKYGWPCEFRQFTDRNAYGEWDDVLVDILLAVLITTFVGLVADALARRPSKSS